MIAGVEVVGVHAGDDLTHSDALGTLVARRIWWLSHLAVVARGKRETLGRGLGAL